MRVNGILIGMGFVSIVALSAAFGTYYTIDQTERGVILRNGATIGEAEPGLSFKLPFIDSVEKFYVTDRLFTLENMEGYSYDQQPANYRISVRYQIPPSSVRKVYETYSSESNLVSRLISPTIIANSKIIIGRFTAQSAIQERAKLNEELLQMMEGVVKDDVVRILAVNVEDIKFSSNYETSIEERMKAEVEVLKVRQNLEREKIEKEIAVTRASAAAESKQKMVEVEVTSIRLKGEAEAGAVKAKGDALKDNPDLPKLITAEKWNGILPATMVPNAAVPLLDLNR